MTSLPEKVVSVADLLGAIGRLAEVLERENRALMARDSHAVRQLGEEKRAACRAYEEAARAVPGNLAAPPRAPAALRAAMGRLAEASNENQRRLAAAITAHKRLLDLVGSALREIQPAAGVYARTGAAARGRISNTAPALSFSCAL